jgi:hypothetical protein
MRKINLNWNSKNFKKGTKKKLKIKRKKAKNLQAVKIIH